MRQSCEPWRESSNPQPEPIRSALAWPRLACSYFYSRPVKHKESSRKMEKPEEKVAFLLMQRILDLVQESGANQTEASCALKAAEAMLPSLHLSIQPWLEIRTATSKSPDA